MCVYVGARALEALENRGAPISKLTDIPITDISAIKNTNIDANTIWVFKFKGLNVRGLKR